MSMDYDVQKGILKELVRMDPSVEDLDGWEQYDRCREVYDALDPVQDYTLVEMVDAVTFEKKWFWRRKS